MSETNIDEVPRGTLSNTETVVSQVVTLSPMTSATLTMSTTGAVGTSIPLPLSGGSGSTITTFRPYVPRFGTTYPLYGMLYSLMPGYQSTSSATLFLDNAQSTNPSLQGSAQGGNVQNRNNTQNRTMPLSNTSIAVLRQQMDNSNHELVNMLTDQMGTVFNLVIQESAEINRQVANQLKRLCNFLGAPT
jgi:hypothetical protein